ncbi:MAG: HNH endonuclease [Parcubacteria group bacterium]|nr:HNH endonuclease [Parcubacteria group bacterium]
MARSKRTKHHRRPKSTGGTNSFENISMVTDKEHRAYHILFRDMGPQTIARILSKKWIDPEWCLVACKKKNRRRRKKKK